MANKFTAGMTNFVDVLNQMWNAFAAGPYNALPLTGGNLTGAVRSTSSFSAEAFIAGDSQSYAQTSIIAPPVAGALATLYDVLRVGVAGVLDISNSGNFTWQTQSGVSGNNSTAGYLMVLHAIDAGSGARSSGLLSISGLGDLIVGRSVVGNDFFPSADNSYTVGTPARRFQTVYASTGAINTSDARMKCDFRNPTSAEIAAARDLARAIGAYRWRDAVDCKGADAREHIGPTVQRAIEIMQDHGLDPFNYGFICHDAWEQEVVEHPAVEARPEVPATDAAPAMFDGAGHLISAAVPSQPGYPAVEARAAYTEVTLEAGDRYAFRYDELAMFIAAGQAAHQDALEQRIAALEAV